MSHNVWEWFSVITRKNIGVFSMDNAVKVSPSVAGAVSAVMGLGAGYTCAPRKYNLERLLMQNKDSFEKTFSQEVMNGASRSELEALENIKAASRDYFSAGNALLKEEVAPNAKKWYSMVSKVKVDDSVIKDVELQKKDYNKAVKDVNYHELKSRLKLSREKVASAPDDVNLNLELKAAERKFADAQLALDVPASKYKRARETFLAARDKAILELPDKGRAISAQWDKVRRAMTDRANVMYEKLATLSTSDALKKDYSIIKKYIPKARTASALSGGILAGIVGVIGGVYSVHKFNTRA